MSETQIEMYAYLTAGLFDPLNMRLCIPIQGKALKASKNPSVRPYGVILRKSNITAGEAMIVT